MNHSEIYNTLAFYGVSAPPVAFKECYTALLRWFNDSNAPPDRLGIHGEGFSGKMRQFARLKSRVSKNNFETVESVELHSKPPEESPLPFNGRLSASISIRRAYAAMTADSSLVPFESMLTTARCLVTSLSPCYGIGYRRDRAHGPHFYAVGISYGPSASFSGPEYEEALRVSSWAVGMKNEVYRKGLLRDIYPYNFLTKAQLTGTVCGISLSQWIQQDKSRGILTPYEGDMWMWSVEESAIGQIREILQDEGRIFAPR
jgi:hypothetical protein